MRGNVDLGLLTLREIDQPFYRCWFEATPAFEDIAKMFMTELASLDAGDIDLWECDYQRILDLGLTLSSSEGGLIDDFLLHVSNCEAWFRC
jgi:hypothetical protein